MSEPVRTLTVAEIQAITEPGGFHFGGEMEPTGSEPHLSAERNPDDDYECWMLNAGQYRSSTMRRCHREDVLIVVQTHDELLTRSAFHPTLHTRTLDWVPLTVGDAGLKLKENARVSTITRTERS